MWEVCNEGKGSLRKVASITVGLLLAVGVTLGAAQPALAQGPYASDDYGLCARNDHTIIDVLANDFFMMAPLDPSTVEIIDEPQSGTFAVDEDTGEVMYMPNVGFYGYDTFSYWVRDTQGNYSNIAWVIVEVWLNNQAPEIQGYTAVPLGAGTWNIVGRLVDDEPVGNRTITLRIEFTATTTVTATTDAEGNFSHLIVANPNDWGWVYAKAIDSFGAESNEAMAYCSPGG